MKTRYQSTNETRLAGAEREIRFLKRRQQTPLGHEGIRFDTSPQEGEFLDVRTEGEGAGTSGIFLSNNSDTTPITLLADGSAGIVLQDTGDSGGDGIQLTSSNNPIYLATGDVLTLSPGTHLVITTLPTSNPGGTNRVWRDSGTLKIT